MTTLRTPRAVRGISLIEMMIAMVIGLIVMLAVIQVFAASRAAYQLSEGLSRVQENSRFAMDTLQRELRMAGHFGCVNDQSHTLQAPGTLATTLTGTHPALDFTRSIQGYEALDTEPGTELTILASPTQGGTDYTPALPTEIADALTNRVDGSDIVALRYLMPDGVPVTSNTGTDDRPVFNFDPARINVLRSGMPSPGLFGVADCLTATVFQATAVDPAAGTMTFASSGLNGSNAFTNVYAPGQTVLYRAESAVFYVGVDATTGGTSLFRVRFSVVPGGGAIAAGDPEALVEGVENMQLLYGQDRGLSTTAPTGFIDRQGTAEQLEAAATGASPAVSLAQAWHRVGGVQLGLLMSSPAPATARQAEGDAAALTALGVTYTVPNDGRMRSVYQSTIAIRNRLFGN